MFDWAMKSLTAFFDERFVFVTNDEHDADEFLTDACRRLGIDTYQQVVVEEYTSGQAATAMAADDVISDTDAVAIYNIDTYVEENTITPEVITGDGYIPVFKPEGDRWSFVREGSSGDVVEVSEKYKISDLATVGFYHFDNWSAFVDAYNTQARTVEREYGETYVAPLYNHLIERGQSVKTGRVDESNVHVLGTPKDLREFDSGFASKT